MTTYTVSYAEYVPWYGQFEIEADSIECALALARDYDKTNILIENTDWNDPICQQIVQIKGPDGEHLTKAVALDDAFLRYGGAADQLLCEAASDLLNVLKTVHREVLEFAKERDPDQLGAWDAIFTPAKRAIAKAEGRS